MPIRKGLYSQVRVVPIGKRKALMARGKNA